MSTTSSNANPNPSAVPRPCPFQIDRVDHIVLQCQDVQATILWYTKYLGMKHERFHTAGGERHALRFGQQKLNLHPSSAPYQPHAALPLPGTQDLCFVLSPPATADRVLEYWREEGLEILEGGVVGRTGAVGGLRSVYTRDPDGNLIEVSNYV
ncbi:Glyoxalase/Bleomycin resistance protein/Dihydroxybiphenyl dioxygenase [Dacryopinax primogenitus]|uniref:Glyoxalase/Bleomycin resistance protein/Dihydroxybiphenyl dioxygenase n=1 Tax=Dacryopinax primogenitus (strain DJM 731) TaxID=1858805 RepID=M5G4H9_DACPD|nr:Glyoxalase/Bleomycin resistance protein/Dihydroxybiphenyl dioxygenase [Dacryopinax primogenitus]EJU05161.1 Glyoxalase/Bleomycin resistance protein/Dihydroxybiphenyl dioxygenase [Dacryopinax primogenitus]